MVCKYNIFRHSTTTTSRPDLHAAACCAGLTFLVVFAVMAGVALVYRRNVLKSKKIPLPFTVIFIYVKRLENDFVIRSMFKKTFLTYIIFTSISNQDFKQSLLRVKKTYLPFAYTIQIFL